jgi:Leishmanolysin
MKRSILVCFFFFLIPCGQNEVAASASRIILREHLRNRPPVASILTPSHKHMGLTHLDYGDNHPFRRHLQYERESIDYGINRTSAETNSNYNTIRFKFILEPILSELGNGFDDKIQSIINNILPAVNKMWSQHLSVFPVQGKIPVNNDTCFGIFEGIIPETTLNGITDADLVVLVHGIDILTTPSGESIQFCEGTTTLAIAATCSLDQYDRPVIGFINFCLNNLSTSNRRRTLEIDFNIESLWNKQVGVASDSAFESGSENGTFLGELR